jgi:hypothetical protein
MKQVLFVIVGLVICGSALVGCRAEGEIGDTTSLSGAAQ